MLDFEMPTTDDTIGDVCISDELRFRKKIADEALKFLKDRGIDAVCAGGFPRDYVLNEPTRGDVDIYIPVKSKSKELSGKINDMLDSLDSTTTIHSNNYKKAMNNLVWIEQKHVYSGGIFSEFSCDLQLIFVQTDDIKKYVFDNFDVSICQCYYDGKSFYESDAFKKTKLNRIITVNNKLTEEQLAYSFKMHLEKVLRKFPHYKLDFSMDKSFFIKIRKWTFRDYQVVPNTKLYSKINGSSKFYGNDFCLVPKKRTKKVTLRSWSTFRSWR
jgi:hypothetical protein